MKSLRLWLGLTVCAVLCPFSGAQQQSSNTGILQAADFARWTLPSPLPASCQVSSSGYSFPALKVGRPVFIQDANPAHNETVIPTSVNNGPNGCTFSAPQQYNHTSYTLSSGTAGLQEAIDYPTQQATRVVEITPAWTGTTQMITGAYGSTPVSILDVRVSVLVAYIWNGSQYAVSSNGNTSPVIIVPGDPTCTSDSTLAARTAVALAYAEPIKAGVIPAVWFQSGCYKFVLGDIRITGPIRIYGDGQDATKLWQANPTGNLFTWNFRGSSVACGVANSTAAPYCPVSLENMTVAGNGHLTKGNLIEIDGSTFWHLSNVTFTNTGGRCVQINNAEQGSGDHILAPDCRIPIWTTGATSESEFRDIRVQGGESDSGTWSYNINANPATGVYPAPNTGVCSNYPAWQPNTPTPEGTLICDPHGNIERAMLSGWVNSTTSLGVMGVTGATAPTWNTTPLGTTTDNGGGNNHNSNVFASAPATGGVTWQNTTNLTPLKPDYHASILISGQNQAWTRVSAKIMQHQSGVAIFGGDGDSLTNVVFECFTGHCAGYSIGENAMLDHFPLTSGLGSSATVAPISNWQWFPEYYNNPSDTAASNGAVYKIVCNDYNPTAGSTPSACGNGLTQSQFELVSVQGAAGDGNVYIGTRNLSGSTAPGGYAWPNTSYMVRAGLTQHGGLRVSDAHFNPGVAVNQALGYQCQCGDLLPNGLSGDVIGTPYNGQDVPTNLPANSFGSVINFASSSAFVDATGNYESVGAGAAKLNFDFAVSTSPGSIPAVDDTNQLCYLQNFGFGTDLVYSFVYTPTYAPIGLLSVPTAGVTVTSTNPPQCLTPSSYAAQDGDNVMTGTNEYIGGGNLSVVSAANGNPTILNTYESGGGTNLGTVAHGNLQVVGAAPATSGTPLATGTFFDQFNTWNGSASQTAGMTSQFVTVSGAGTGTQTLYDQDALIGTLTGLTLWRDFSHWNGVVLPSSVSIVGLTPSGAPLCYLSTGWSNTACTGGGTGYISGTATPGQLVGGTGPTSVGPFNSGQIVTAINNSPTTTFASTLIPPINLAASGAGGVTSNLPGTQVSGAVQTATNLAAGVAGSVPYQSAAGTTALQAPNTTATPMAFTETNSMPSWQPFLGGAGAAGALPYFSTTNAVANSDMLYSAYSFNSAIGQTFICNDNNVFYADGNCFPNGATLVPTLLPGTTAYPAGTTGYYGGVEYATVINSIAGHIPSAVEPYTDGWYPLLNNSVANVLPTKEELTERLADYVEDTTGVQQTLVFSGSTYLLCTGMQITPVVQANGTSVVMNIIGRSHGGTQFFLNDACGFQTSANFTGAIEYAYTYGTPTDKFTGSHVASGFSVWGTNSTVASDLPGAAVQGFVDHAFGFWNIYNDIKTDRLTGSLPPIELGCASGTVPTGYSCDVGDPRGYEMEPRGPGRGPSNNAVVTMTCTVGQQPTFTVLYGGTYENPQPNVYLVGYGNETLNGTTLFGGTSGSSVTATMAPAGSTTYTVTGVTATGFTGGTCINNGSLGTNGVNVDIPDEPAAPAGLLLNTFDGVFYNTTPLRYHYGIQNYNQNTLVNSHPTNDFIGANMVNGGVFTSCDCDSNLYTVQGPTAGLIATGVYPYYNTSNRTGTITITAAASGSSTLTWSAATPISVPQKTATLSGTGIAAGTTIVSVVGSVITLSTPTTATTGTSVSYSLSTLPTWAGAASVLLEHSGSTSGSHYEVAVNEPAASVPPDYWDVVIDGVGSGHGVVGPPGNQLQATLPATATLTAGGNFIATNGQFYGTLTANATTQATSDTSTSLATDQFVHNVVATSGLVTSVSPNLQNVGNGADGTPTISGNVTLSGEHYYTNWTCPFGSTVTVNSNSGLVLHVSGTATIACTIYARGIDRTASTGGFCGSPSGGSGGGTAAGTAGIPAYISAANTGNSTGSAGAAGAASGGNGANAGGQIGLSQQRSCANSGGGTDYSNFGGANGVAGANTTGVALAQGGIGVTIIAGTITGTDGTNIGVIDTSGGPGLPATGNSTGASSGGGGGPVILSSQTTPTTWPTIYQAGGPGSLSGVIGYPEALGVGGTCTSPPKLLLSVSSGALGTTATVEQAGAGCGTGAGIAWQILGGGGTPGTAVITPTWSGGAMTAATVTPGTSSGYTATTYTTSGAAGDGAPGWFLETSGW